jgi:hypothetical protein
MSPTNPRPSDPRGDTAPGFAKRYRRLDSVRQKSKSRELKRIPGHVELFFRVMAGLVPAIHAFLLNGCKKGLDARDKRGHDGWFDHIGRCSRTPRPAAWDA